MTNQSRDALENANKLRHAQGKIRQDLARLESRVGRRLVATWLEDGSTDAVEAMRVGRLVESIRHCGPDLTDRYLSEAGFALTRRDRRVRELTDRERVALAWRLRGVWERDAA